MVWLQVGSWYGPGRPYLHFESYSLAGLGLLFLLGRSLKFEIANAMWFLSTCAALRTRTRTVNAVFSTFVLRAYDFIEFADAMPPLTSPFRVNTRRAKYHTISFPPFPPGRLGSTLHSHLKMGRHGASRSNSLSPFPFPSFPCLAALPISLNDASETLGERASGLPSVVGTRSGWRIWSAQESIAERERERVSLERPFQNLN